MSESFLLDILYTHTLNISNLIWHFNLLHFVILSSCWESCDTKLTWNYFSCSMSMWIHFEKKNRSIAYFRIIPFRSYFTVYCVATWKLQNQLFTEAFFKVKSQGHYFLEKCFYMRQNTLLMLERPDAHFLVS